jgi:tetratricopeptide (TPR) repeat protein
MRMRRTPAGIFTAAALTVLVEFLAFGAQELVIARATFAGELSAVLQVAQRQFDAGNYSSAITTLQAAATQNSNSAEIYYWLGRNYYELRDFDNAITHAEKSVQLDPKNSLYHDWLGRAYGGKADRERSFSLAKKVKREFQEAVRLDPSNIAARRNLQEYDIDAPWIAGGNKDEAREQVEAITAIDPVRGHLARAALDMDLLKKPELAENEYREALKSKPAHIEPYIEAIAFYVHQNKPAEVEAVIQSTTAVGLSDPRLGFYRGVSRVLSVTELPRAEEYLKAYLASTPDRSDWPSHSAARDWLGRLYEAEGKNVEAAEQYRAALQLDPERKETRTRLQQLEKKSH